LVNKQHLKEIVYSGLHQKINIKMIENCLLLPKLNNLNEN